MLISEQFLFKIVDQYLGKRNNTRFKINKKTKIVISKNIKQKLQKKKDGNEGQT